MYKGKVYFCKEVEPDNYFNGVSGSISVVSSDTIYVDFADTDDLLQSLAQWASERFDVDFDTMRKGFTNECQLDRFDYYQNENADGLKITITENNPDGYHCSYSFYIDEVLELVDYKFGEVRG